MLTNVQLQLTYGLPFLFELETSQGYQHRYRVLQSKGLPSTPVALAVHLQRALSNHSSHTTTIGYTRLDNVSRWTPRSGLAESFPRKWPGARDDVDRLDSAPFRLWLEVHKWLPPREMCYWPENLYLRKCGYVIWDIDIDRAVDLGVDDETRQWIRDGTRLALIKTIERQRGRDRMKRSWKERAAIREKGGRGYWDPAGLHIIFCD